MMEPPDDSRMKQAVVVNKKNTHLLYLHDIEHSLPFREPKHIYAYVYIIHTQYIPTKIVLRCFTIVSIIFPEVHKRLLCNDYDGASHGRDYRRVSNSHRCKYLFEG
jgi:hypothetical protein